MTSEFIIGHIGSPHGLNGFVKVRSASGEVEHLLALKSVCVCKDEKRQTLTVEETAFASPAVLMRFQGIDSSEKAKLLSGAKLLAGREQAAPLADDEYYIEDIKGLPVVTENGETIGFIKDIIEGGGGDLAEIKLSNGEIRLVPFRKEFFSEICPKKGRLVLQNLWILE